MAERFTILRRPGPGIQPSDPSGAGPSTQGCERCRRLADNSELAEGRRLEILRLQRRVQELEEQLRQARATTQSASTRPGETNPPPSPPWDETSTVSIPIEHYPQR